LSSDPKVIVALDFDDLSLANQFIDQISPGMCRLKVGKEMFTYFGPSFVAELVNKGFDVFLDLKFHDIPNTVAKACKAAAHLGVWMLNVHAAGGPKMMAAARDAIEEFGSNRPKLISVTMLTSMDEEQAKAIGVEGRVEEQVLRLAKLTRDSGLDGVVCSAREASVLKSTFGQDFCLVTPGIRPAGATIDDQNRVMAPKQALDAGSDYLVIGRPVTQSSNPLKTLEDINTSLLTL